MTQTGVRAEVTHNGWSSRAGRNRTDTAHLWMDPIIVAGPWVAAGVASWRLARRLRRRA